MAGTPLPTNTTGRARALIITLTVVPVILLIGGLFLLGANNAEPTPTPTPSPSTGVAPEGPPVAVIPASCRTLPIDTVYAFEAVPLPPSALFGGDVAATELGAGLVAKRYTISWPEGGFADWFATNLGSWSLSGGKTTVLGSGLRAAELVLNEEEIVGATVIVESGGLGSGEQAVVRVEMDSGRADAFLNAPLINPDRTAISIGRDGQGDACSFLSAYFYNSAEGTLIESLYDPKLGSLFQAVPFDSTKSIVADDASSALRPIRLPDGGWRIPVEADGEYTFTFARPVGSGTELVDLYTNCGVQEIISPIIYSSPQLDALRRPRYILRVDLAQITAENGSSCRNGLIATLEQMGEVAGPTTVAGAAPQLNGLAVGLRYGEWLQYRPELIAKLQAAEVATDQAGPIGSLALLLGLGGSLGMGLFAYYLFRVMDRRRRVVRTGKGIARGKGRGRQ